MPSGESAGIYILAPIELLSMSADIEYEFDIASITTLLNGRNGVYNGHFL